MDLCPSFCFILLLISLILRYYVFVVDIIDTSLLRFLLILLILSNYVFCC